MPVTRMLSYLRMQHGLRGLLRSMQGHFWTFRCHGVVCSCSDFCVSGWVVIDCLGTQLRGLAFLDCRGFEVCVSIEHWGRGTPGF